MDNKVYGDRLLVEEILIEKKGIEKGTEFKGEVVVLGVGCGEKVKEQFTVGEHLIVTGTQDIYGENYVIPMQIVRRI